MQPKFVGILYHFTEESYRILTMVKRLDLQTNYQEEINDILRVSGLQDYDGFNNTWHQIVTGMNDILRQEIQIGFEHLYTMGFPATHTQLFVDINASIEAATTSYGRLVSHRDDDIRHPDCIQVYLGIQRLIAELRTTIYSYLDYLYRHELFSTDQALHFLSQFAQQITRTIRNIELLRQQIHTLSATPARLGY